MAGPGITSITEGTSTASPFTLTLPGGATVRHVLIIGRNGNGTASTPTLPSGWTQIYNTAPVTGEEGYHHVVVAISTSSTPSTSITWAGAKAWIVIGLDADVATEWHNITSRQNSGTTSATLASPTVTTTTSATIIHARLVQCDSDYAEDLSTNFPAALSGATGSDVAATAPGHHVTQAGWVAQGASGTSTVQTWPGGATAAFGESAVVLGLAVAAGSSASPADAVGISDTVATPADRPRTQDDPLGLTDAAQTTMAWERSAADSVGLTDSLTVVSGAGVTINDPLGVSDALALGRSTAVGDTVGATDLIGTVASRDRTANDPVGVTDNVTIALSIARAIDDQVGITDSATGGLSSPGSADIADPLGVTDLLATTAQILRTAADNIGVTDGLTVGLTRAASPSDPLGISDSVTVQTGAAPSLPDAVGISDAAVAVLARVVVIADQVAGVDAATAYNPASPQPVTPAERTYNIAAETRAFVVPAESRRLTIAATSRTLIVEPEA